MMLTACSHGAYTSYKQPVVTGWLASATYCAYAKKTRSRQRQHVVMCRIAAGTTALLLLLLLMSERLRSGAVTNQVRATTAACIYIEVCAVCDHYQWVK